MIVDQAMFAEHPNDICLKDCVSVEIDEMVTSEQILDRLCVVDCVEILCSEAQRSAVIAVSEGVSEIKTGGTKKREEALNEPEGSRIHAER